MGALRDHDLVLRAFVARNPLLAAAVFVAIYALVVGLSLPGGAVMTVSSGFLFGLWTGSLLSVVGATAGAIILFLVARLVAGDALRARAGPFLKTHGRRLQAECVFLPAFAATSAAISLLGGQSCFGLAGRIRLRSFATATLIGVIPGALAYASVGEGLDRYLETRTEVSLGEVLSPPMIAVRVGLALLALLPIVMQWARKSWPS
jgi:uncharacterized membrane protein YdjX (TVP38/TMEM64 family)